MALIKCIECGKEFSDKAPSCPNCGCPIEKIVRPEKAISTFDDVFDGGIVSKMNPGAVKKARDMISSNENVLFASTVNVSVVPVNGKLSSSFSSKGKVNGVFVVTERRVLFVQSMLGIGDTKQILKKDITSIDSKNSLMNCPVRIKGLTEMFVVDCSKESQKKILSALQ